ncbi:hypothetical protein [Paenibacillus endoradicis]|uniref:hypothetical protein n=1 Tax=Paenibacillus endoradicis TaxID=2972487 RepID=UPI002159942D|nr:hypothetical protein [Paenibacillus endoradicis]MCR8657448.1 hypothetical protein [Paenibacillus endoradicis]
MSKNKVKPIRSIHLADQQFANQIVGKYGWRIDNGFARSKLQHRVQPKKHDSMTFAKSPVIHLTKVIQPLHIKLIYEHHQLNQIVEYKNASLLVNSTSSNEQRGASTSAIKSGDAVINATSQRTSTLLEKVIQKAHEQAERKVLQQVQSQIKHKTILTTLHDMQRYEGSEVDNGKQSTATLLRIPASFSNSISNPISNQVTNQRSDSISATSSSPWINTTQSIYSFNQTIDSLHHIEQKATNKQASKKQVALAKVLLSPYIRNIVREEQERITTELVERNKHYRTKATLHGLVPQSLTPITEQFIARKVIIDKSLLISMERWHRKLTIAQISILRQQKLHIGIHRISSKLDDQQSHTNAVQRSNFLQKATDPALRLSSNSSNNSSQLSLQYAERGKTITQTNREPSHSNINHKTIINDVKYYLKTTPQHIHSIKHHQRLIQNEQKLVYVPFVNRKDAGVTEKAKLIYRNQLTQVDSRITNNQHSYKQQLINNKHIQKQEIANNEHSHKYENINSEQLRKQEVSSKVILSATRQIAILTGELAKKQQRRIEATTIQIRSVTSFHQQLIKRNERLIYGIEIVEKKKTPRARKLSLVPVVKLSYRVLPEEQRKASIQIPQAQHTLDKDRQTKRQNRETMHYLSAESTAITNSSLEHERQANSLAPSVRQRYGIRRQAQLIYTVNRKHELRIDQQTTNKVVEQTTKQMIQQVKEQLIQQVKEQVTHQVTQQGQDQVKQQNRAKDQQSSVSAIVATNKGNQKQLTSSSSGSNARIIEGPYYNKISVSGQLTHISKVNKMQLQQVKVLHSKLKQLQATTMIVPTSLRTAFINLSKAESGQSSNNDSSLPVTQTNHNENNFHSKQLVYRQINSNNVQQLGTLINELHKTRNQTIQSSSHNISVIDVPSIIQPLTIISTTMNSLITKRINLIHSSHQQSERITKRIKQIGGSTLLRKMKNIISTQSSLSTLHIKTTAEQDLKLIVNEQHHKSNSQIVEQVKHHTQSSMNLHVAKQQSMQQDDSKQLNAMKQLEVTVKRLEQEISVAKETPMQPNINIRQLSDQLFDQISKKIRLEKHRNGR